jgi:hypothetical protein
MVSPVAMSASRTYLTPLAPAYDFVLPMPLEQLFSRRFGPIPAVRGTQADQAGWDAPGQTRTIRLADGGTLREQLIAVDRPTSWDYRLTEIRGPLRPLAAQIDGRWIFEPAGNGTRITWAWTMHPRSVLLVPVVRVFARIWGGFARRALDRLEAMLPTG